MCVKVVYVALLALAYTLHLSSQYNISEAVSCVCDLAKRQIK